MKKHAAYATEIVVLAALYVLVARAGLKIDAVGGFATLVWPSSGIALAALPGNGATFILSLPRA